MRTLQYTNSIKIKQTKDTNKSFAVSDIMKVVQQMQNHLTLLSIFVIPNSFST